MIKTIKGDLLACDANIIVHVANCFNCLGAGVALQIAKKYPEAVEADNKTECGNIAKLGAISVAQTKDKKFIINLYGQFDVGTHKRQLNYEAFYNGITLIRDKMDALYADPAKMRKLKLKKIVVGFPYGCGCGLAGGSWIIVHTMLRDVFTEAPYEVLVVELDK